MAQATIGKTGWLDLRKYHAYKIENVEGQHQVWVWWHESRKKTVAFAGDFEKCVDYIKSYWNNSLHEPDLRFDM